MVITPGIISAAIALLALAGNLLWTMANLRIENRIGAKIEGLKEWMALQYVSSAQFAGLKELLDERHKGLCKRLDVIESERN